MKKILLSLVIALMLGLTGCKENHKDIQESYKILNNSSSEITIKSYSERLSLQRENVIPVLEVRPLDGYGAGFPSPIQNYPDYDYCTISNGERIVTQRREDNDELYTKNSYMPIGIDDDGDMTYDIDVNVLPSMAITS